MILGEITIRQMSNLIQASGITIALTLLSIVLGLVFGLVVALGRLSRVRAINIICWVYIWVFRGTPLLLQIYVVYFILPRFGLEFDAFQSAVVAFSLNSTAYLAEIFRAAIQSIDKGQMEAAKALGMSYRQAMFSIIIPQSIRRLTPPVGNEVIMLLKDTSMVGTLGTLELLKSAKNLVNVTGSMTYYVAAGAIYLFYTTIFTWLFQKLEKKFSIYE